MYLLTYKLMQFKAKGVPSFQGNILVMDVEERISLNTTIMVITRGFATIDGFKVLI
jgi:hypothetical protein